MLPPGNLWPIFPLQVWGLEEEVSCQVAAKVPASRTLNSQQGAYVDSFFWITHLPLTVTKIVPKTILLNPSVQK